MKVIFKKTLGALLISSLAGTQVFAATAATSIDVSVEVVTAVAVSQEQALDLGLVVVGDTAVVAAPADCTDAAPADVGIFKIDDATATDTATVDITTADLTGPGTAIPFTVSSAVFCSDIATAAVDVTGAGSPITFAAHSVDNNKIYLGGTAVTGGTQAAGAYTGTISVTLTY